MRRASGLHRLVRILVALLVFAGASSQGLAALLCPLMPCAKPAPVKAPTPVVVERAVAKMAPDHSCCAPKVLASAAGDSLRTLDAKPDCCCEIAPATEPLVSSAKSVTPAGPELHVVLAEAPVLPEIDGVELLSVCIPHASDSSPPERHAAPDRGRAPPRA